MKPALFVLPVLMLSACATPRERCISDATQNLRVVNGLISQLETDIARGYGTEERQTIVPSWRPCHHHRLIRDEKGNLIYPGPDMCFGDTVQTETRPVAIDLAEARKTLAELKKKSSELSRQAGPAVAQCESLYPK